MRGAERWFASAGTMEAALRSTQWLLSGERGREGVPVAGRRPFGGRGTAAD